jgi:hypothetical protein
MFKQSVRIVPLKHFSGMNRANHLVEPDSTLCRVLGPSPLGLGLHLAVLGTLSCALGTPPCGLGTSPCGLRPHKSAPRVDLTGRLPNRSQAWHCAKQLNPGKGV